MHMAWESKLKNSRVAIFKHRIQEAELKINLIKAKDEGTKSKAAVAFGLFLR